MIRYGKAVIGFSVGETGPNLLEAFGTHLHRDGRILDP
jgi:hypothetical protein